MVRGNACVGPTFPLLSSIDLAGTAVPLSYRPTVKTLGVTLDSKLTFRPHITNLCKSCFYHIRTIRHIRLALTKEMSQTIACSLVSSRLDNANSLFVGVSDLEVKTQKTAKHPKFLSSQCCVSQDEYAHQSYYYISCIAFLWNSE